MVPVEVNGKSSVVFKRFCSLLLFLKIINTVFCRLMFLFQVYNHIKVHWVFFSVTSNNYLFGNDLPV